ncbi:MAG: dTDP-4-dehydrorhamnose reductase [Xanthomonadales bacterium]|nr:dTDP-4-dehydrorhamnose reductase [Xanthomonadales bacterium]
MNILLTGAAGQLGCELLPLLNQRGRVTPLDRSRPRWATSNWMTQDLDDGGKLEVLLNRLRPELIVNTAAYTAVDQAEQDPVTACDINAALPGRLAHWAQRNDSRLVHYSTDYIFNGQADRPYREADLPDPLSVYGDSKLAGERAVAATGCKHVILRTSWVYSSHGSNFVLSMLNLARRGLSLKVVDDQRGCPTWARNLALATDAVIARWQASGSAAENGVFHYCDDRPLSWYEFAHEIFGLAQSAGLLDGPPDIEPVPSSGFQQPAQRPHYSILDTSRIGEVFDISPAVFDESLRTVIDEIRKKELE